MAAKKRCDKNKPSRVAVKTPEPHLNLVSANCVVHRCTIVVAYVVELNQRDLGIQRALRIHFVTLLALCHPGRVTICSASGVYSEVGSRKRDSSGTQAVRKHNKGGSYTAHPESMRCAVIALMLDLRVSEMVDEKLVVIPT